MWVRSLEILGRHGSQPEYLLKTVETRKIVQFVNAVGLSLELYLE